MNDKLRSIKTKLLEIATMLSNTRPRSLIPLCSKFDTMHSNNAHDACKIKNTWTSAIYEIPKNNIFIYPTRTRMKSLTRLDKTHDTERP